MSSGGNSSGNENENENLNTLVMRGWDELRKEAAARAADAAAGGAGGGGAGPYSSPSLSPSLPIIPRDRRFARSPSPYRMPAALSAAGMYRSHSPLESTAARRRLSAEPAPNIFRIVQEGHREVARREARNRELSRLRALIPNAYEEDGVVVIPPAAQRMGAPAPIRAAAAPAQPVLPPIHPAAAAAASPEPNNPRHVNNNNNNNPNPQPRRNHRRRTRRRRTRRRRNSSRRR